MSVSKVVIHTDVLMDHLTCARPPSLLRLAAREFFCYTTVYNAMELFATARTAADIRAVEDVLSAVKTLGVNGRNARRYAALLTAHGKRRWLDVLVAGLCIESRLPLLTGRVRAFRPMKGLVIVPANDIRRISRDVDARLHEV